MSSAGCRRRSATSASMYSPWAMAASMPAVVGKGLPTSRSSVASVQWRICWRSAAGTPRISQMISTGKGPEKSTTASKASAPARASSACPTTRATTGSHAATRRGVKARLTSLRIRSWRGGSIMISDPTSATASPNAALRSWSSVTPRVELKVAASRWTSKQSS